MVERGLAIISNFEVLHGEYIEGHDEAKGKIGVNGHEKRSGPIS